MSLKYDWATMGALEESITACRLTIEIETAFPQLEAVNYPAKRDAAIAELLICLDPGATKYAWTNLGQREESVSTGRLTAEIHDNLPELDGLSYPVRRDAALTELIVCAACSGAETWSNFGSLEDPIVSGRMAAETANALPGLQTLSTPAKRDALLAELISATFPCGEVVVDPPETFPGAVMVLWLEADFGVQTKDLRFLDIVV